VIAKAAHTARERRAGALFIAAGQSVHGSAATTSGTRVANGIDRPA
jgi:hypothetical protein